MQKFFYKAWDGNFDIVKGIIEDEDIETARGKLKAKDLNIIEIKQRRSINDFVFLGTRLKEEDLSGFCAHMATILSSGVNIISGLEVIREQVKNKRMKKVLSNLAIAVRRGSTLARAMEESQAFPKLLSDMIYSGEISGNLDTMFSNMESFYEREAAIKGKIKTASVYPSILLMSAVGMITFFNIFIFPDLKDMFKDTSNLPGITRILIGLMDFSNSHSPQLIIGVSIMIILIKYLFTIDKVKYFVDIILVKLPIFGLVKKDIITARFTRSMALLLKSSVPILELLDSIQLIVGNLYYARKLDEVKFEIVNGAAIATSMDAQQIFDPLVIQMIKVGEETGRLEETLFKLANIYDKRAEAGITRLMALVEPMFTLVIGIFVGTIVLSMAMPIMQMTNTLK